MRKQIPEITSYGLYMDPTLLDYDQSVEKPTKENIEACKIWIREWIDGRRTINKKYGSYALKHFVEEMEKTHEGHISNGAFIQAAKDEGYRIEPFGPNSPNAYFNMNFVRLEREQKWLRLKKDKEWRDREEKESRDRMEKNQIK